MKKWLVWISWLLLAPLDLLSGVLAVILAPFVVPFQRDAHLPKAFHWMETYDNDLNGDGGHIERWAWVRDRFGSFGLYLQMVGWLWRNKAYNFAYYKLGKVITQEIKYKGNPEVESYESRRVEGYYLGWTDNAWCLFVYKPWLTIGKYKLCWRIYCGWKLKSIVTKPVGEHHVMLAFHINPFRYYKVD